MLEHFSIYDKKSQIYAKPWEAKSVPDACRQVSSLVSKPGNTVADFPHDFAVYRVGFFNETSGEFVCPAKPEFIAECGSFVKEMPKNA